jgi:perosamine synthetase
MTNVAAAIGCAQLERVGDVLARKRTIATRYGSALANVPGVALQDEAPWAHNVWWMVSILVDPSLRDPLMQHLKENGVDTRPFFHPAHTLPMYRREESFPVAERLGASGINLPSAPTLTDEQIDRVSELVADFMATAC